MIQQYRHPVRAFEWEIPAGLLDVHGEPPHVGAARELHEEADLTAGTWHVLADCVSSPGGLDEALRIYLAATCPVAHADRHVRDGEELGMPVPGSSSKRCAMRSWQGGSTTPAWRSRRWRRSPPVTWTGPRFVRWTPLGRSHPRRSPR